MYRLFEKKSIVAYGLFVFLLVILGIQIFKGDSYRNNLSESFIFSLFYNVNLKIIHLLSFFTISLIVLFQGFIYRGLSYSGKGVLVYQTILLINLIIGLSFEYSLTSVFEIVFLFFYFLFFLNSNKEKKTSSLFFGIGVIFGLSLFISLNQLLFFPILLFSINIYEKNGVSDFFAFLIGLIVPIYIIVSFFYLTDRLDFVIEKVSFIKLFHYDLVRRIQIVGVILIIIKVVAAFPIIPSYNIQTRKFYTVLLGILFMILPFYILFSYNQNKPFLTFFMIGSLYLSSFITAVKKNNLKNLILISGFLLAIILTFVPIT